MIVAFLADCLTFLISQITKTKKMKTMMKVRSLPFENEGMNTNEKEKEKENE